jgi:UrcA family protein
MIRLSNLHAAALALSAMTLAATLAGAAPSLAEPQAHDSTAVDAPLSVVVRFGDLNLSDPGGARAMLARIQHAATRSCGRDPDPRDLEQVARLERCRADAVDRALAALGSPAVTALAHDRAASAEMAGR